MRLRLVFLVVGAVIALLAVPAPAAAIETTTFGIDVVDQNPGGRLTIEVKAGETTGGEIRVWNKGDQPLMMRLSVVPARVAEDGTASLGGDPEPTGWVEVPSRVELAAGEEQRVAINVTPPRRLGAETRTVAVLAEPELVAGDAPPAVLQRLAVTTYLVPDEGSLIASLGWLPWVAAAALVAVMAALVRRSASRRRRSLVPAPPDPARNFGAA